MSNVFEKKVIEFKTNNGDLIIMMASIYVQKPITTVFRIELHDNRETSRKTKFSLR